jgi:predicted nuclease with TOPRIM domain
MKLEELHELSKEILNRLSHLQIEIDSNMEEIYKLNTIPDEKFHELRFISDHLEKFTQKFDELRNYGIAE